VHEQVEVVSDVQVRELEGAGQGDDEGRVERGLRAQGAFLRAGVADFVVFF
jgi:hypothetical protein